MIASPLNYTGGKYRLLPQLLPLFPRDIRIFADLFCGGCNVGLNTEAEQVLYNDADRHLVDLFTTFRTLDRNTALDWIDGIIARYGLSDVSTHGYAHYRCDGATGLAAYNREPYLRLRRDFNQRVREGRTDDYSNILFYVLIVYAFNNQIRFNSQGEYNLPVGKRDFNAQMRRKLTGFIDRLQSQNCRFTCRDFRSFDTSGLGPRDLVYADPPLSHHLRHLQRAGRLVRGGRAGSSGSSGRPAPPADPLCPLQCPAQQRAGEPDPAPLAGGAPGLSGRPPGLRLQQLQLPHEGP